MMSSSVRTFHLVHLLDAEYITVLCQLVFKTREFTVSAFKVDVVPFCVHLILD
jgi:hypothetical protein